MPLPPEHIPHYERFQQGKISTAELAKLTGRSFKATRASISWYGYTRHEKWPPEKTETLIWLCESQATLQDVAKVMERWGWGKINPRALSARLYILRQQGHDLNTRKPPHSYKHPNLCRTP